MTAQPIGPDPDDPQAVLWWLPEAEHAFFLTQYRAKVEEAKDPGGYRRLRAFLHAWSVRAQAVSRPGYGEEQAGDDGAVPIEQVLAESFGIPLADAEDYWSHRVAAAAAARRSRG